MPERIQLSRAKGWRMPPNTVRVTRPGRWGNEFRIGDLVQRFSAERICENIKVVDAATAVALYQERMDLALSQHPKIMREAFSELRGKNLACWCKLGAPCHADVLLHLANEGSCVE